MAFHPDRLRAVNNWQRRVTEGIALSPLAHHGVPLHQKPDLNSCERQLQFIELTIENENEYSLLTSLLKLLNLMPINSSMNKKNRDNFSRHRNLGKL